MGDIDRTECSALRSGVEIIVDGASDLYLIGGSSVQIDFNVGTSNAALETDEPMRRSKDGKSSVSGSHFRGGIKSQLASATLSMKPKE